MGLKGHGVSIGSETSGWIRNITIRDSRLKGTDLAVRLKTQRGIGGGIEDVVYQNLTGEVLSGVQLTLNYDEEGPPANQTPTPTIKRIFVKDVHVKVDHKTLDCKGLWDSTINEVIFENVIVTGSSDASCSHCEIFYNDATNPAPRCRSGSSAFLEKTRFLNRVFIM